MFKILAIVALATGAYGGFLQPAVTYSAPARFAYGVHPVPAAYAAPAAHLTYAAPAVAKIAAPVAYAAPTAHLAYAAPAPVVAKTVVSEEYDPNPQYSYAYNIEDGLTGDSKNQYETRSGDLVQGSYSLNDADGTRRIVEYTADPVNGFNAVVHKEPLVAKVAAAPVALAAAPIAKIAAPLPYALPAAPFAKFAAPLPLALPSAPIAKIAAPLPYTTLVNHF